MLQLSGAWTSDTWRQRPPLIAADSNDSECVQGHSIYSMSSFFRYDLTCLTMQFSVCLEHHLCPIALQVGNLDLPLALLQTANFMCPYISVWSITADGTGAGAMKARNTLLRHRLKPSG